MKWKKFLTTLAAAIGGGVITGLTHALSEGVTNPKAIGVSAASGALIAVSALLKHSPLEPDLMQPPKPDPSKDATDPTE